MYDERAIIEFYLHPNGIKTTCKHFHIGEQTLRKILKENGVHMRKPGEHCRIYYWDDSFFYKESHNFAYFLGLMGSDGCIADKKNQIYIELQASDGKLLEQLREKMQLTREIKYYTTARGYKSAKIYLESKELKQYLIDNYGLCPNKTYSPDFSFPYKLDKQYWRDYIRGYFDGDGSVKMTGHALTFQIDCSNFKLITTIKDYLEKELNVQINITSQYPPTVRKTTNDRTIPLYRLYAYGEKAQKILSFLYENDPELFLERKYQKFVQLITND